MADQSAFADALLSPDRPVPPGLVDPAGRPAGKRFDIYRNTVASTLAEAMDTAFPAIRSLVGAEFFRAMAGVFLRAHPPGDPRLQFWGGAFPGFLRRFGPVAHLPYLADVARLELGLRQSYHAADARPLALAGHTPEAVLALRPRLSPATLVLSSPYPVLDIWRFARGLGEKPGTSAAQDVLIARPAFDPVPTVLPPGGLSFLRALKGKRSLAEALIHSQALHPEADAAAILSAVLAAGALTLDPVEGAPHARPD